MAAEKQQKSQQKRAKAVAESLPADPAGVASTPWLRISAEVLASRAVIAMLAILARYVVLPGPHNNSAKHSILEIFRMWDSNWYLGIVFNGYSYDPSRGSSIAFFPLYPALVYLFSLGRRIDPIAVAYLLSLTCNVAACCILWRIANRHFKDDSLATIAYRLLLLFPAAFFSSIIYSEGLFLLCMLMSLDAADRSSWLEASLWGAATALTRSVGILVAGAIFLTPLAFKKKPPYLSFEPRALIGVIGSILGLMLYMGYLSYKFGDPLAFMATQKYWGRELAVPWYPFLDGYHNNGFPIFYKFLYRDSVYFFLLIALYGIVMRMPLKWLFLMLTLPMIYVSSTSLESIPRYLSTLAPSFIVLAHACRRIPVLNFALMMCFAMLQMLCVVLFTNGYWFT